MDSYCQDLLAIAVVVSVFGLLVGTALTAYAIGRYSDIRRRKKR